MSDTTSTNIPASGKAVRFDRYGPIQGLYVTDVDVVAPTSGEVLVAVKAAGTNPGEGAIREGELDSVAPAIFPSGEGSDFAGVIVALGDGVDGFAVGDEILGWSNGRNSQAQYVTVPVGQFVTKPAQLSWEVAGGLYVVGVTAYAAVRAVDLKDGDTVVVSAAAGGVGSLAVQLAAAKGATVIGIASEPNHEWLRSLGVTPIAYGDGLADRIRQAAASGIDAFIDTFGPDYVHLAVELGVKPDRIETIIAFDAAKEVGAKAEGSQTASTPQILGEVAGLVASGTLTVPIARTYRLEEVAAAYTELEKRHTRGKIVLIP